MGSSIPVNLVISPRRALAYISWVSRVPRTKEAVASWSHPQISSNRRIASGSFFELRSAISAPRPESGPPQSPEPTGQRLPDHTGSPLSSKRRKDAVLRGGENCTFQPRTPIRPSPAGKSRKQAACAGGNSAPSPGPSERGLGRVGPRLPRRRCRPGQSPPAPTPAWPMSPAPSGARRLRLCEAGGARSAEGRTLTPGNHF